MVWVPGISVSAGGRPAKAAAAPMAKKTMLETIAMIIITRMAEDGMEVDEGVGAAPSAWEVA